MQNKQIIYKNKIDINVLDKDFYSIILERIKKIKDNNQLVK